MCVHHSRIPGQPSAAAQLSLESLVVAPQQQASAASLTARSPQLQPPLCTVVHGGGGERGPHGHGMHSIYKKDTVSPFQILFRV